MAHVNEQLGIEGEKIGITNFGMVLDPNEIPGVYDKQGDIVMDLELIFKSGFIAKNDDPHPSKKFNEILSYKVEKWVTSNQ